MAQPPGFIDASFPHYVCKLNKTIYGLKQAPRAWYTEFANFFLLIYGFKRSVVDASLFIHHYNSVVMYLILYVDYIILTRPHTHAMNKFIQQLATRFAFKDLGSLSYFLGVEVIPTVQGLFLSQQKYIVDLLTRTSMIHAKSTPTPMVTDSTLTLRSGT